MHFVDYGEDSGPIVGQSAFAVGPRDTLESVRAKGLQLEWALYPECIRLFAEGRLKIVQRDRPSASGPPSARRVVAVLPP